MVLSTDDQIKKIGVLNEKNKAYEESVLKLEEHYGKKSFKTAKRDATKRQSGILQYVNNTCYDKWVFANQEEWIEGLSEYESINNIFTDLLEDYSIFTKLQEAIDSVNEIINDVDVTDKFGKKSLLLQILEIEKNLTDLGDFHQEKKKEFNNLKRSAKTMLADYVDINESVAETPLNSTVTSNSQTATRIIRETIPKFSGDISHFANFQASFKNYMETRGITDTEAGSWLCSEYVMKDSSLCPLLQNLTYAEMWEKLQNRYSSEVKATSRMLRCFKPDKNKIKYGKDLELFSDEIEVAVRYLEKLDNPREALLVFLIESSESLLPEEVAKDQRRILANMKTANVQMLVDNINLHSKMTICKGVSAKPSANSAVNSEKNYGEKQSGSNRGSQNKKVSCNFCKKDNHKMYQCKKFLELSADKRLSHVLTKQMCTTCLSPYHVADNHPGTVYPCRTSGCDESHHSTLHEAMKTGKLGANMIIRCQGKVGYLGLQLVPVEDNEAVVLWDTGANVHLVTEEFVTKGGFKMKRTTTNLDTAGSSLVSDKSVLLPLVDREGNTFIIQASVVDSISECISALTPTLAGREFNMSSSFFDCIQSRNVDLLIGTSNTELIPVEIMRTANALLMRSKFSRGFFTIGTSGEMAVNKRAFFVTADVTKVKPVHSFLDGEKLGVTAPKRCVRCAGCKACSYQNEHVSWVENRDLQEIEKGLTYLPDKKQWKCEYAMLGDPRDLPNNYNMVREMHHKLLKRLIRNGHDVSFNDAFAESVERGVYVKMNDEDLKYDGPVNYIPLIEALKEGPGVTTPVRVCANSSMKYKGVCLNDILCKGPSALNSQWDLLIKFRCYKVGLVMDIRKFYNSIHSVQRDMHLRRVLWSPEPGKEPDIYLTATVNFGDRPAGCTSIVTANKTAEKFADINPNASKKIIEDSYVDDIITGDSSVQAAKELEAGIREILAQGSFELKPSVISGDNVDPQTVLGIEWNSFNDVLSICCKVNVSAKKKGVRVAMNLDLESLAEDLPEVLTLRQIFSVVMAQFDPLGLLCPIIIQLKLVMRSLSGGTVDKKKWDAPVPKEASDQFKKSVLKLRDARQLSFQRCVFPDQSVGKPSLCVFVDGSSVAYCALVYLRWETCLGVKVHFLTGRTRVGPLNQVSVVRMELNGGVLGARLCASVKKAVDFDFDEEYYFTDSTAMLGLIRAESGSLSTYGGNRIGEIQELTRKDQWKWIRTDLNIADLGTRGNAEPADLNKESEYQNGPDWLYLPTSEWPAKLVHGEVPREELSPAAKRVMLSRVHDPMVNISKYSSFKKTARVLTYVFKFVELIRRKKKKPRSFTELYQIASNHLYSWYQYKESNLLEQGDYKDLGAKEISLPGFVGTVPVIVMTGRTPRALKIGYDQDFLILLSKDNPLAVKHLYDCHQESHCGAAQTLDRSRRSVWITGATHLAKSLVRECMQCRLSSGNPCKQKMAPLPESRFVPGAAFKDISLDLFGPLIIKDSVKKRTSGKTWGVMFVCHRTSAVAIELMESYSTDAFLLAFRKYIASNGVPDSIVSDLGTQLVSAAKKIPDWNWEQVKDEAEREHNFKWDFIPTASPHCNGQAERHIGIAKRLLEKQLADKKMTFAELDTVLKEVVHIMNTKPYPTDITDPATGSPLTPQHLLGSRGRISVPSVEVDEKANISKRFQFVQRTITDFWKKYMLLVFPKKIPIKKWLDEEIGLQEGDVVQVLGVNIAARSWRLAVVCSVTPGADGLVRKVKIKIAGASDKNVEVAVQKLRFIFRPPV